MKIKWRIHLLKGIESLKKYPKIFFSSNLKKFQRQQKNLKDDEIIKVEKGDKETLVTSKTNSTDNIIRLVLVGDGFVGKTSMVMRSEYTHFYGLSIF